MQLTQQCFVPMLIVICLASQAFSLQIAPSNPTTQDVDKLRGKLEKMATGLVNMLSPESDRKHAGSLSKAKVAPVLRKYAAELRANLKAAATLAPSAAMAKLRDAQSSVDELTKTISEQQASLMKQGEDEQTSLLIAVLMSKKGLPLDEQLSVLTSPDFSGLPVTKELLMKTKAGSRTPLYQLAAACVDAAQSAGNATLPAHHTQDAKLERIMKYFQQRVRVLEKEDVRINSAREQIAKHTSTDKIGSKSESRKFEMIKRRMDREYKKRAAANKRQLDTMRNIVSALQKGDVSALEKAEKAIAESMNVLQRQTGNFLHLIQLGHRIQGTDCPYCAAQCIDKCHSAGNPFTKCLQDCADAGK